MFWGFRVSAQGCFGVSVWGLGFRQMSSGKYSPWLLLQWLQIEACTVAQLHCMPLFEGISLMMGSSDSQTGFVTRFLC